MPSIDRSDAPVAIRLTADGYGRLPLPKNLAIQIPWLKGKEPIGAWLLLISLGRFRLLKNEEVQSDPDLAPVRDFLLGEQLGERCEPSSAEPSDLASLPVRLLRILLRPHGSSWRLSIPPIMEIFAPANCDRNDLTALFSPDGYLDIWYTEALRHAALGPLPAAMRGRNVM